jgi:uncharacterized phage-associated protein
MDPRAIANLILDMADCRGVTVSNLALNKIVYFLHGIFLARFGRPLIDAKIEAWQYGPVFREIYHQFKKFGDKPINERATVLNAESGEFEVCSYNLEQNEYEFLQDIADSYLKMRPSMLVELSHVRDGPWHNAWFYDGIVNPGMEITNESIEKYFKQQVRH